VSLFLSLIIHKGAEAFGVGLQVGQTFNPLKCFIDLEWESTEMAVFPHRGDLRHHDSDRYWTGSCTSGFSLPLLVITKTQTASFDKAAKDILTALLTSMACGTFIYVTFLEVRAFFCST